MNARTKYTDGPIGDVEIVEDFLPSPAELALEDETTKVTIALSKTSVYFFKQQAAQYGTSYQKMIRRLLDAYARRHSRSASRKKSR